MGGGGYAPFQRSNNVPIPYYPQHNRSLIQAEITSNDPFVFFYPLIEHFIHAFGLCV